MIRSRGKAVLAALFSSALIVSGLTAGLQTASADNAGIPSANSLFHIQMEWTQPVVEKNQILIDLGLVPPSDEPEKTIKSSCTGWAASQRNDTTYIATAGHCVDPQEVVGAFDGAEAGELILSVKVTRASDVNDEGANTIPAQVVDFMPKNNGDVALLRVDNVPGPVVPLRVSSQPTRVGDEVTASGYPKQPDDIAKVPNLLTTFGNVTAATAPSIENGVPFMTIQAPIGQGMSGGPVLNDRGEVVGVVSRGVKHSDLFSYATDQEGLADFLGTHGITPTPDAKERANTHPTRSWPTVEESTSVVANDPFQLPSWVGNVPVYGWALMWLAASLFVVLVVMSLAGRRPKAQVPVAPRAQWVPPPGNYHQR